MIKKYVIRLADDLLNFRIIEFESLASLFGLNYKFIEPPSNKPLLFLETDNEEKLLEVINRSVLSQSLYELWVSAPTYEYFINDMKSCNHIFNEFYSNCSFRIQVDAFGKKISLKSKIDRIEKLNFLPFNGPINLKNPDVSFYFFEYYGDNHNEIPEEPYQIVFGKWIVDSNRKLVSNFSLKKRKFIANTSMEPILGFVMSNLSKINKNDIVYDPFVGSGSLLVSAAHFGAYVCGTDIDFLLLHGLAKPSRCGVKERDKDESVFSNLKQYNLESKYLDIIIGDSSLPLFKKCFQFDAIITDPPYGKRESRERVGTTKNYKIPEELKAAHIPSKLEYNIEDIYKDLLNFASKHLKMNGRISFWVPYSRETQESKIKNDKEKQLPQINFFRSDVSIELEQELMKKFNHPNLKFISFSEQSLNCKYSRILITMERIY